METKLEITKNPCIKSMRVERIVDECGADCMEDYIGSYSNEWKEKCIDRKERGDMLRGEYRYFHPAEPDYAEENYKRAEDYNNGYWCFYGIRAEAIIIVNGVLQKITSGGLWGIESDSEEEYFKEVEDDEMSGLKKILSSIGVTETCPEI